MDKVCFFNLRPDRLIFFFVLFTLLFLTLNTDSISVCDKVHNYISTVASEKNNKNLWTNASRASNINDTSVSSPCEAFRRRSSEPAPSDLRFFWGTLRTHLNRVSSRSGVADSASWGLWGALHVLWWSSRGGPSRPGALLRPPPAPSPLLPACSVEPMKQRFSSRRQAANENAVYTDYISLYLNCYSSHTLDSCISNCYLSIYHVNMKFLWSFNK